MRPRPAPGLLEGQPAQGASRQVPGFEGAVARVLPSSLVDSRTALFRQRERNRKKVQSLELEGDTLVFRCWAGATREHVGLAHT